MTEKKRPTPARAARVRRLVNEALDALSEIEGSKAVSVSAPLCSADAALKRWIDTMAINSYTQSLPRGASTTRTLTADYAARVRGSNGNADEGDATPAPSPSSAPSAFYADFQLEVLRLESIRLWRVLQDRGVIS